MLANFLEQKLSNEKNAKTMAGKIGISEPCLCLILQNKRFPSGRNLIKILRAYPDLAEVLLK